MTHDNANRKGMKQQNFNLHNAQKKALRQYIDNYIYCTKDGCVINNLIRSIPSYSR